MVKWEIDTLNETGFLLACKIVPLLCEGKEVELVANCMVDDYIAAEALIFLPKILAEIDYHIDFDMSFEDFDTDSSSKDGDERNYYRIKLQSDCKAIA